MAEDGTKQSIRNVLPDVSGETNSEEIKMSQFLSAAKQFVTSDWRHTVSTSSNVRQEPDGKGIKIWSSLDHTNFRMVMSEAGTAQLNTQLVQNKALWK